jgi:hypothetical protein
LLFFPFLPVEKNWERILKTSSEAVFLVVYDPSMNEL